MGIRTKRRIIGIVLVGIVIVALSFIFMNKVFCSECGSSVDAIDSIDSNSQMKLDRELSKEGEWLAVFPESNKISIKRGAELEGFAFGVRNKQNESNTYSWEVFSDSEFDYIGACGGSMNKEIADSYLMLGAGIFRVGSQEDNFENSVLVLFNIPMFAANCTIPYKLSVADIYNSTKEEVVFVTIEE